MPCWCSHGWLLSFGLPFPLPLAPSALFLELARTAADDRVVDLAADLVLVRALDARVPVLADGLVVLDDLLGTDSPRLTSLSCPDLTARQLGQANAPARRDQNGRARRRRPSIAGSGGQHRTSRPGPAAARVTA
jgi:hypothetical protein